MRIGWGMGGWVCAVVASAASMAWRPRAAEVRDVLRVRQIEIVDARDRTVGVLGATDDGVALVLGGEAQASLVTDGTTAALNLLGEAVIARLLGESCAIETPPPADDAPRCAISSARDDGW